MYAVFETGGKQYRAVKGASIRIEKMPFSDGQILQWEGISFLKDGTHPVIVHAEPLGVFKEPKVIIFKKKRRHTYRRKNGHRQSLLLVKITDVIPSVTG